MELRMSVSIPFKLFHSLKERLNSYYWVTEKSSVNVYLMKELKGTVTKKVIVCSYNLG